MNSNFLKLSVLSVALISSGVQADLVIKSGQVIGSDGKIYDGMSPQTAAALAAQAEAGELKTGVINGNFYVILDDVISTVPLRSLSNLEPEERVSLIKESFALEAREAYEAEYRASLSNTVATRLEAEVEERLEVAESDVEREVDDHLDDIEHEVERQVEDHLDEIEHEIEREVEDHLTEIEHEIEREVEDHLNEIEHEIEREVEGHMEEIEHEIESHSQEIERDIEHHSESHDDDHDEHDDDD
jgi:hypothetical protein